MSERKQIVLNFFSGFVCQAIILVVGLIVPRIIITHYGSDANGLIGTVTQIFTYMALLEAGIAQAAKNALFKPIKENDRLEVSRIMSTANSYYRRVTVFYAIAVFGLSFLLPIVLKTEISYWQVFTITIIEGLSSVVSFFFLQKWLTLLNADGRTYFSNFVTSGGKLIAYGTKILLAMLSINIACIQIGYLAATILQTIVFWAYAKRNYPWVNCHLKIESQKLPDRNYYVITEVAWTIFSSTDMIVLSLFVSTSLASVYYVYNMVFIALNGLLTAVYNSVSYRLGKDYVTDIEKYKKTHDAFNSLFMTLITVSMCVTYWLIIPFVSLYTHGVTDIAYVRPLLPLFFCLIQMLTFSRYVAGNLSGLSGHAKETSIVSLIEALLNISLSFLLVFFFDIVGVLLATLISLPLKVVYTNWLAEKKVMNRKPWKTLLIFGVNYSVFAITVILQHFVWKPAIANYWDFILYGFLFVFAYAVVVLGINLLVNKDFFLIALKKTKTTL